MKNPNDSYWTSGSDVHLPEYDPPEVYGRAPLMEALPELQAQNERNRAAITEAERQALLNRRLVQKGWRGWRIFNRRSK